MRAILLVAIGGLALSAATPGRADPPAQPDRGTPSPAARVKPAPPNLVRVLAKVLRFRLHAAEDYESNGSTTTYAATEFELLAPAPLRGRRLVVYHDVPPAKSSPFVAIGKQVRFRIDSANLQPSIQLFAAALIDLALQN